MRKKDLSSPALKNLNNNIQDVRRLLDIVSQRKSYGDKKVLRHAAIILFTACWETFVADLAQSSFEFLCKKAKTPKILPNTLKKHISDKLKEEANSLLMWELADSGWKKFIKKHGKTVMTDIDNGVSNPNSKVVDELFLRMIGLKKISQCWQWKGVSSPDNSCKKLANYLQIRSRIAHRTSPTQIITTGFVVEYTDFIFRLAIRSNNKAREHLMRITKKEPWASYGFRQTF